MKLWKCDAMGPVEGVMVMQVVVMAETRQQAIEKASAKLSAKLPGMLGQMFPEDGDRRDKARTAQPLSPRSATFQNDH